MTATIPEPGGHRWPAPGQATGGNLLAVDPSAPDCWWASFRQVGSARVIHVDLTPHEAREATSFAWLDDVERARRDRFQHAPARRRFVLCRAALRSLLCAQLGCSNESLAFGIAEGGKPFAIVDGQPVPASFNVSHSGRHGLIALAAAGRVGVDVEEYVPRRDLDQLIAATFGPGEQADMAAVTGKDRVRQFFRLWTLKEAAAKALGTGLSFDVSRFEIPGAIRSGAERGLFQIPQIPDLEWQLTDLGTEQFAAALAQEVPAGTDRA